MHADPKIGQQDDELLDKCICFLTYTFCDVAIWLKILILSLIWI